MHRKTYNILGVFMVIIAMMSCAKNETQQTKSESTSAPSGFVNASIPKPGSEDSTLIGEFAGTNEEGDYWLLFVKDEQGNSVKFIFNDQAILDMKDKLEGKRIRVKWVWKEFEQAGSGEKFRSRFAQSVELAA